MGRSYAEAILGVADRAHLKDLADRYARPVTDAGLLIVRARWIATEKLIVGERAWPRVLNDIATLMELALG